ncbi:hypothetical protein ABPG74_018419 [Tetrahymena malaccensis]
MHLLFQNYNPLLQEVQFVFQIEQEWQTAEHCQQLFVIQSQQYPRMHYEHVPSQLSIQSGLHLQFGGSILPILHSIQLELDQSQLKHQFQHSNCQHQPFISTCQKLQLQAGGLDLLIEQVVHPSDFQKHVSHLYEHVLHVEFSSKYQFVSKQLQVGGFQFVYLHVIQLSDKL